MENLDGLIEECVYHTPLALLAIKNEEVLSKVNNYLPYSSGFEIECNKLCTFSIEAFKMIPDIMDINVDVSEQRFRIPNGVAGLICLYNICEQLKENSELNMGSGIHYHIDMTDCYESITNEVIKNNKDWILKELESWEYKGTYNPKEVSRYRSWVRFNEIKTMEVRIGEMSFDYEVLVKRIIHANQITRRLREEIRANTSFEEITPLNRNKILSYVSFSSLKEFKLKNLTDKLRELQREEASEEIDIYSIARRSITNRVVKVKKNGAN